ncbi:hypothetical protein MT418_008173, partial [Batrachochytrium dendrobatidis]
MREAHYFMGSDLETGDTRYISPTRWPSGLHVLSKRLPVELSLFEGDPKVINT